MPSTDVIRAPVHAPARAGAVIVEFTTMRAGALRCGRGEGQGSRFWNRDHTRNEVRT
jgi:hypothetical protein